MINMSVCLLSIVCKTTASGSKRKGHVSVEVKGGGIGKSIQDFHYQVNKTSQIDQSRVFPHMFYCSELDQTCPNTYIYNQYILMQTYSSSHVQS